MKSAGVAALIFLALMVIGCTGGDSVGAEPLPTQQIIENKGSDTMVNLALAWAERYQSENSEVNISVTGGGSGTGIASLANGTLDIANASREIKPEEIEEIKARGTEPVEFTVARDAIAVIINLDNPVEKLTLEQISAIYKGETRNWSELGGEDRPIVKLSRETNSGTHVYFLENVVRLGDSDDKSLFSPDTLLLPSSEGITAEVRDNPNAIGYDGLGYVTPEVKVVAVSAGGDYIYPSIETVNALTYPIARDLYMYTAGEPAGSIEAYMQWIFTEDAQEIVKELGFVPVLPQNP